MKLFLIHIIISSDKKAPKKLSDVKIDPKLATTIMGLASQQQQKQPKAVFSLAPPPSSSKGGGFVPNLPTAHRPAAVGPAPPAAPSPPVSNMIDLLGDFTDLPAAPPPAPVTKSAASAGLGAFNFPAPPVTSAGFQHPTPFPAAPSAPASVAGGGFGAKPPGDGFDFLLGQPAVTTTVPKQPAYGVFDDPFGSLAAPKQGVPPAASNVAFSSAFPQNSAAVPTAASRDPFATLVTSSSAPPSQSHSNAGGVVDPFATIPMAAGTEYRAGPGAPPPSQPHPPGALMGSLMTGVGGGQSQVMPAQVPVKSSDPFAGLGF